MQRLLLTLPQDTKHLIAAAMASIIRQKSGIFTNNTLEVEISIRRAGEIRQSADVDVPQEMSIIEDATEVWSDWKTDVSNNNDGYNAQKLDEELLKHDCKTCGKEFSSIRSLRIHQRIHQPKNPRTYCENEVLLTAPSSLKRYREKHEFINVDRRKRRRLSDCDDGYRSASDSHTMSPPAAVLENDHDHQLAAVCKIEIDQEYECSVGVEEANTNDGYQSASDAHTMSPFAAISENDHDDQLAVTCKTEIDQDEHSVEVMEAIPRYQMPPDDVSQDSPSVTVAEIAAAHMDFAAVLGLQPKGHVSECQSNRPKRTYNQILREFRGEHRFCSCYYCNDYEKNRKDKMHKRSLYMRNQTNE